MLRLIRSFGYAIEGLRTCLLYGMNFRIHTAAAVIVTVAAVYLDISKTEWLVILICFAAVFSMEMVNTAIEELCNIVNKEHSPLIKTVKDIAAAAVLITAAFAMICGCIIFIPKIISLIQSGTL